MVIVYVYEDAMYMVIVHVHVYEDATFLQRMTCTVAPRSYHIVLDFVDYVAINLNYDGYTGYNSFCINNT